MRIEIVASPRAEIIDRKDLVAASEQQFGDVRPDLAAAARNEHFHCTLPECMTAANLPSGRATFHGRQRISAARSWNNWCQISRDIKPQVFRENRPALSKFDNTAFPLKNGRVWAACERNRSWMKSRSSCENHSFRGTGNPILSRRLRMGSGSS